MTRFFKNSKKIQKNSSKNSKFPNKFKISPKFCKKLNKFQENFSTHSKQSPKIQQTQKKFSKPKQSPKKFHKKKKAPPPSPYFQPLKPFFVIFCNTFLKKFANFCHKSEKLYYNFIVLKICLQSRVCLNALQQAHTHFAASKDGDFAAVSQRQKQAQAQKANHKSQQTPFATQIFSSKFTAKRISSTKKERTRDEEITRSHHTRAF